MVLAHTSTGLREIKPSPCNVFAAANPRAKTPAEIQTRCLNPGPDTAASTPSLCAAAATPPWGSFSAGMEGGRVPRGHSAPSTAPQHRAAGTQQHQAPPRRLLWLWQSPSPISWGHLRGCSLPGCRGGSLLGRLGEKQGFWGLCIWEGAGRQLKDPSAPAQSSGAGLRQDVPPPSSHPHFLLGISINVSTSPSLAARSPQFPPHTPSTFPVATPSPNPAPWGPAAPPDPQSQHFWGHRAPGAAPIPWGGKEGTYLGALLLPGEGPRGGLASSLHPGAKLGGGKAGCAAGPPFPSFTCSEETTALISPRPFERTETARGPPVRGAGPRRRPPAPWGAQGAGGVGEGCHVQSR